MKGVIVEFVSPTSSGPYFNGTPGALTQLVCEGIDFTPCGIYFRNVRMISGRPETGPHWVSILIPTPEKQHVYVRDVEISE